MPLRKPDGTKESRTMLTELQIEKKLYEQTDIFKHHMRRKEYLEAALCVDRAAMTASFVELDEPKVKELFGDREPDEPVDGLISEQAYIKACDWCTFEGGYATRRLTYQNVRKIS